MARFLVVEDDTEKLRRVILCLRGISGISFDNIDNARDANAAKQLLRANSYDLLVLDVSLPARADEAPTPGAGLDLLNEIQSRDIYNVPMHIVGLTAYEEALKVAKPQFDLDVLQLVHYDPSSSDWQEKLTRIATRSINSAGKSAAPITYDFDLCVIAALAKPELQAVLNLPWNWSDHEISNDPTQYHVGTYENGGVKRRVIAASAARMGMQASAVLASKMIMSFRPRYVAMTGILAGIEGTCELGDIVIADPTWDYGSGKRTIREGEPVFAASPHQIALNPFLRSKLTRMAQDTELMDKIRREWSGTRRNGVLSAHIGPVASGAAVLEDQAIVATVLSQHRKTVGVEMETYGVFVAGEECGAPAPAVFSLKSVCDFANTEKNDNHQDYAAYTSAAALRFFAETYL
jgi:nucleoside phosphorylase